MKKLLLILFTFICITSVSQSIESTTGLDSAYYEVVKLTSTYIPNDYPAEGLGNSSIIDRTGSLISGYIALHKFEYPIYSYLWLREKYKQHCDSIVIDTLEETGIVHYQMHQQNGELKLIPLDTVWEEKECREYLIPTDPIFWWNSDTGVSVNMVDDYNMALSASGVIRTRVYSTPIQYFTTEIKRFKYCKIKYKKGSQEDFWNWVDRNYLK